MEAVRDFPEESLDFVHIDANHDYDYFMPDLIEWNKRVKVGGIVSGHDYSPAWAVKRAVDDYIREHKIENCYYTTDHSPSFWWVKERGNG